MKTITRPRLSREASQLNEQQARTIRALHHICRRSKPNSDDFKAANAQLTNIYAANCLRGVVK
ncbi:MAG: hypothetical protein WC627_12020 [Legionella sp.]|jgi:hypothetical protein